MSGKTRPPPLDTCLWIVITCLLVFCSCKEAVRNDSHSENSDYFSNAQLADFVEEKIKTLREKVKHERNLLENPIISNLVSPYEAAKDFYFYKNLNVGSGNTDHLLLTHVVLESNGSSLSGFENRDVDVVNFGSSKYLLLTTESGLRVTSYEASTVGRPSRPRTIALRGAMASESIVTSETLVNGNGVVLFVLLHTKEVKRLVWHTWSDVTEKLIKQGSCDVNTLTTDIRAIQIPSTDGYVMAALQHNSVSMYDIRFQNGEIYVKLCSHLDAFGVRDLTSFSINGQLYVVVGNGQARMSFVWKYHTQKEEFIFHHSLEEDYVTSLEYFRRGFEHNLAVIASNGASIYRWEGARFLRIQRIDIKSALPPIWHGIKNAYDGVLLLMAPEKTEFFSWNKFWNGFSKLENPECIRWRQSDKGRGVLVPLNKQNPSLQDVKHECIKLGGRCAGVILGLVGWQMVQHTASGKPLIGRGLYKSLQPGVSCWNNPLGSNVKAVSFAVADGVHHLVVMDRHNLITYQLYVGSAPMKRPGRQEMPNIQPLQAALARQEVMLKTTIKTFSDTKLKEQETHLAKPKHKAGMCHNLKTRMEHLERRLKNGSLNLATLRSERNGTVHLKGVSKFRAVYADRVEVKGNAEVTMVNDLDVTNFFKDAVLKHVPTEVRGSKTFLGRVTVNGPLTVHGRLNGQRIPEDFILLNRPQHINGTLTFLAPVSVQKDVDVVHDVNGIDLSSQVVLLSGPTWQHITGPKTFSGSLTTEECIIKGHVNGVNISRLATDIVVSARKGQVIEGKKTFSKVNFTGSVEVDTINGVNLRVLDETTVKINRPAVVTAPKVFAQTVRVAKPGRLLVESINGMRIPHDLVTKSEPRVLAGTKTFLGNVRIRGDLKLNGTLDGVDLGDLVLTKGDQALCGQKTFVGRTKFDNLRVKDKEGDVNATLAVIHGNVLVTKTINNWPVEILLKDFVFKNEAHLEFLRPVSFLRPQVLKDVEILGRVNGYRLKEDFVHFSTPNVVTGLKIFEKRLVFERNLHLEGTLDGIDLEKFVKEVVRLDGGPQTVRGVKKFVDAVVVETVVEPNHDDTFAVKGPLIVKTLNVKRDVIVNNGLVNNVNLKVLDKNRITLTTDQEIMGSAWLVGSPKIGQLHVSGKLNDVNVSSLWEDVLWKKSPVKQIITGRKDFRGQVTIQNLETLEGINGINLRDVKSSAVLLDDIHQKHYTFIDGIRVDGSLVVTGKINGVEFNDRLVRVSAKKSEKGLVKGLKEFEELHVKGNVIVLGHVNGLKLQRDVLTVNTAQNVTGSFTFAKDLITQDVIKVRGLWSSKGVEVVHLTGEVIVENLFTGGDLNGIDVSRLWADSVHDTKGLVTIKGRKTFAGKTTFAKNMHVVHDINGFGYPQHLKTIVTIDGQNQVITASKEFKEDVSFLSNVSWSGNVEIKGFFNDVNISNIKEVHVANSSIAVDTVLLPGSLEVLGNLYIKGTLNGIRPSQLITRQETGLVWAQKAAKEMFVKGDIRARRVNGWNLTELETDTLKTTTTQQVCGRKVFLNEVKLGHLKMMESRRQPNRLAETLPTRLRLRPELPDGKSIEFYGRVNFSHGLTITGKLHTAAKLTSEGASSCQWDECLILKGLQMQLSEMATALDSFHSIRSESGSFANVRMEVVQSENFVHVILGFADCKTQLRAYIWNPIQERFFLKASLGIYAVHNMKAFVYQGQGHVVINHFSCETGHNYTTVMSPEWKTQIRIRQAETVLHVDTLSRGRKTVVASINAANKLKISKIDRGFRYVKLGEIALPPGAHVCKFLASDVDNKRVYVIVGISYKELLVYAVELVANPMVTLMATLKTAELSDVAAVTYKRERSLAVITKGVVKIYGLLDNGRKVTLEEVETIGKMNDWPLSLESLEMHGKSYLMVQARNSAEVFVQEGASSFVTKAKIQQEGLHFVQYFTSPDLIYAVVFTNHRWNTYESVMKGAPMKSLKQLNCSVSHP